MNDRAPSGSGREPPAGQRPGGFSWDVERWRLAGLPGGRGLNLAYEAVDRQVDRGHGAAIALRVLGAGGARREVSYAKLAADTNRFAGALGALGVQAGDRVHVVLGRGYELFVALLGSLKHRAVVCPMFSAFGPDPVRQRLVLGEASVVVTSPRVFERSISPVRADVPTLRHVIVTGDASGAPAGTLVLDDLLAGAPAGYDIGPTSADDPALLHFTSGTTGKPKGALHVHGAVLAHQMTGELVLGLRPGDVYWCTADPGWVTGTSYGVIAPLTCAVTTIVDEQELDVHRWYRTLSDERVAVWYTAPTAIRMLMRAGDDLAELALPRPSLRTIASVGEPLGPDAVVWSTRVLGLPIHDTWWQTETGGIMVASAASDEVRPGSMGRPVPGIDAAIARCDPSGAPVLDHRGELELVGDGVEGMLVLRAGWPSMFRAYIGADERYRASFVRSWYLTGDLAKRDADGYYWFVARADDVIKTAGHLIGPFEVECVLTAHPAVVDAGVYGVPDPVAGAVVHAAVVLRDGCEPSEALHRDLVAHARKALGAAVAPRQITFADQLPKTRSGKIMRRLLRARELGLPEQDTSTLEVPGDAPARLANGGDRPSGGAR